MRNNPFRALNENFNKAAQPLNTSTALGTIQGRSGKGTSMVEGPVVYFLQQILIESPELEKEIARLHQTMMKDNEMLEE